MAISRDNHFVPQMYLKKWGIDNKIFVHRFLVPHEKYPQWESCSIRGTAYIENLYMRIEDGKELDDFEIDFNSQFETPAKPVLDRVSNGQKMSPENWHTLCEYMIAQLVRTPLFYHWVLDWGKQSVPKIVDSVLEKASTVTKEEIMHPKSVLGGDLLPLNVSASAELSDTVHTSLGVETVIGKNLWLYIIYNILFSDSPVKQLFYSLKWSVISAPLGITWPTCDAPVVIATIDQRGNLYPSNTIGKYNNVVIFPVSPSKVLWGAKKRDLSYRFEADQSFADKIVKIIIENALMYVYCSSENSKIIAARERIVDKEEFLKYKKRYVDWYDSYKKDEAPLLTRKKRRKNSIQEGLI